MALKELKKEMRHCAVSPLIFLWREYLSYKVFPERKLGQQPCDEVAQCEGTEGQRQDEPRCAQFHGLQYVEKDGVEHDDVLTSSSCHPKIFVKEFSYFLMSCHQHCLGVNLLVQR